MATARSFAYNSGTGVTGTTQVGSLAVGDTSVNYGAGLTWWNGPDESLGYVIGHTSGARTAGNGAFNIASPTVGFWRSPSLTDQSFLDTCNLLFGQGFGDTYTAKTWLNTNGYWTSYGGLITNGLTLRLDASNSSSYPGSGTTWYDIAGGTADNITLVNSPTYTSSSPSYFTFNSASSQRGSGSGSVLTPTSYTKSLWFYLNSYTDNNLISMEFQHYMFFGGGNKLYCGHTNWAGFPNTYPSTATFSLNTWYNVTLTFNTTDGMKLYINGSLDSTYTAIKTAFVGDGSVNIASYGSGNFLNGRIGRVYCYNRAITASEALQNFNSEKNTFGL